MTTQTSRTGPAALRHGTGDAGRVGADSDAGRAPDGYDTLAMVAPRPAATVRGLRRYLGITTFSSVLTWKRRKFEYRAVPSMTSSLRAVSDPFQLGTR